MSSMSRPARRATAGAADGAVRPSGQWLLLFRVASALVILLGGAVIHLRQVGVLRLAPLVFFYGALAVTFFTSLGVAALLRARAALDAALVGYPQLAVDVVLTTVLVYATGGQDSVLTFLFPLNTLYAAALVSPRAGSVAAMGGSASFAALVALQAAGVVLRVDDPGAPFDREALSVVMATVGANFLVAMLGGQLSQQLRSSGERLVRARKDLRALQSLQSAMVQSLSSGMLSVSPSRTIQLINPAAERILGLAEGEGLGKRLEELLPALGEHPGHGELSYRHPDGRPRHISYAVSALHGVDDPQGYVVSLQDVTAQRELETAIQRSRQLATVGEFAAGLAHELRNPLGSMIGCVELLQQSGPRTGDEDRLLAIVHREAERLERLVRQFLHYARPALPEPVALDVDALLAELAEEVARDSSVTSPVRWEGGCGLKVQVDPGQLRQVLWNLLRNAAQVSPEGAPILLRAEPASLADGEDAGKTRPAVRITVEDRGPGVPADVEHNLFQPFFSTRSGGTGLGLAIVHRIVEAHGGRVGLVAAGGPGATFHVTLPQPDGTHPAPVGTGVAPAADALPAGQER